MKRIIATVSLFLIFIAPLTRADSIFRAYGFLSHSAPGKGMRANDWDYQKAHGLNLFGAGLYFNLSWLQSNLVFFQTNYATAYDIQIGVRRDFIGFYYGKHGALTKNDTHQFMSPQYLGLHIDREYGKANFRIDAQYGFGTFTYISSPPEYHGFWAEEQKDYSTFHVAPQLSYNLIRKLHLTLSCGMQKYSFMSEANFYWNLGFVFGDPFLRFFQSSRSIKYSLPDTHLIRKPNIYLYPETPMQVDVSLQPQGHITVSIPDYQNGWSVWAEPHGRLDDAYNFLFYEAEVPLVKPSVGWCVSVENLEFFFNKKLRAYGFNDNEVFDFLEYWLPMLTDAPFYEIRPMVNEELDWVCPITITPQPDNLLRLWLLFTPVDQQTELLQPTRPFFDNSGFYATEWGGAILP